MDPGRSQPPPSGPLAVRSRLPWQGEAVIAIDLTALVGTENGDDPRDDRDVTM
jgi:hypothetical protein